ncbi:BMC domain-containing protein [Clostridium aminobutyricum]|uniref:BMC domain-containing protein n=1 Tax=Clostridium aminobutyricum TaxID=33953 RepID=A0A939DAP5_CLOAM|nr:BMC domain-containing protein [Clostridium aminobutyricum]MBN7773808.1 BMC domain-containing protein [Clostridium aminobutyricum]
MANAVGMIELNSIAQGIEVADYMMKAAQVDVLRATTVCPGKYIIIIGGETGSVDASMKDGMKRSGPHAVDTLMIPNINDQVIPAIYMSNSVETLGAVGVLEFFSVASAITAADVAAKAANIALIEVRMGWAIGGKGVVTLTGDVGAVRAAVTAAEKATELMVGSTVIPRPSPKLLESLL